MEKNYFQMTLKHLDKDLEIINNWNYQWKMNFNPDPPKKAQEAIFSGKAKAIHHPLLMFKNTWVLYLTPS